MAKMNDLEAQSRPSFEGVSVCADSPDTGARILGEERILEACERQQPEQPSSRTDSVEDPRASLSPLEEEEGRSFKSFPPCLPVTLTFEDLWRKHSRLH